MTSFNLSDRHEAQIISIDIDTPSTSSLHVLEAKACKYIDKINSAVTKKYSFGFMNYPVLDHTI